MYLGVAQFGQRAAPGTLRPFVRIEPPRPFAAVRYPNHGGAPTCLDYAVSRNVSGPYERRGTIIDNTGIDPQSWNNHGSILKIKNQWYVFYHGSSNNSKYTRRARVERIDVDETNGYIKTAQITSNGFANALNPEEELSAAHGYRVWGGAYFTEKDGVFPLVNVRNGAAVAYRYYDFGENGSWDILLKGRFFNSGDITIAVNDEIKARICVDRCESFIVTARLNDLCGLADIKLLFNAAHDADILELDVIRFMRK